MKDVKFGQLKIAKGKTEKLSRNAFIALCDIPAPEDTETQSFYINGNPMAFAIFFKADKTPKDGEVIINLYAGKDVSDDKTKLQTTCLPLRDKEAMFYVPVMFNPEWYKQGFVYWQIEIVNNLSVDLKAHIHVEDVMALVDTKEYISGYVPHYLEEDYDDF